MKRSTLKSGTISKYFQKENTTANQPERAKHKGNDSLSDMDDFRTPKAINKVSKISKSKIVKNTKKRKKTSSYVTPIQKFMQTNLSRTDVNPDHLQMALALSESSYQAENPDQASPQEKMDSFRLAFEKYGFGYSKNRLPADKKREQGDSSKRNKKSRYRFVTPVLNMRTEEERQDMISSKVALILAQNNKPASENHQIIHNKVFSDYLRSLQRPAKLFHLHQLELEELNERNIFYLEELGLDVCSSFCGKLLKDWTKIAGRDISPVRTIVPQDLFTKTENTHLIANEDNHSLAECYHEDVAPKSDCDINVTANEETIILESFSECVEPRIDNIEKTQETNILSACSHNKMLNNDLGNDSSPRSYRSLSPDLFDEDEDYNCKPENVFTASCSNRKVVSFRDDLNHGLQQEIEILDLTNSDVETPNESLQNDELNSPRKIEKISTSDEEQPSQESICISDDELNYSSAFATPNHKKKVQYNFSDEEECFISEVSLEERIKLKEQSSESNLRLYKISNNDDLCFNNGISCKQINLTNLTDTEENCTSNPEHMVERIKLTELSAQSSKLTENYSVCLDFDQSNKKETVRDSSNSETNLSFYEPCTLERISSCEDDTIKFSQESIYISDDELNYSCAFGTHQKNDQYNFSEDEENYLTTEVSLEERIKSKTEPKEEANTLKAATESENENSSVLDQNCDTETPKKCTADFLIKTSGITPMAHYDEMDTPKIVKELDKFGLKPLKRQKAAKLLKYIYDTTHPVLEDEEGRVVKKRRMELRFQEVACGLGEEEDLYFEKSQSRRIASCPIPLHIVWHNLVINNSAIRENILLYEPLQLEVLHELIKEQGFRFKIQDLLSFLDKKCITFWTAQGQSRGKNRH